MALAVIAPGDPVWQVAVALLGGGAALAGHAAKAGGRVLVNTSPEPFTNVAVSLAEDGLTAAGLWLVASHPEWAAGIAALLLAITSLLLWGLWRVAGSLFAPAAKKGPRLNRP